jgi:hypothetical protein|tara:strand:+ start:295 stop:444 length:150 start_codon:yes stop_codon:yes gene_type:complete
MRNWFKQLFLSLVASRETEAQRRIAHYTKFYTTREELDSKMREAGYGGL